MAKHYRSQDGTFAGTWIDGTPQDDTLIEVDSAPTDGLMIWDGSQWVMPLALAQAVATEAIQAMIDSAAVERNYDSGISLASYA